MVQREALAADIPVEHPLLPEVPARRWYLALRRTLDLFLGSILLLLCLPVALGIAVAIKRDSPGPILFRQTRIGRRGRSF
ncbi:MAG: sugar transferase, partial [Candidatus Dormibacteraeota bacterium]|nr:sugar transferase [Candidatus Dormibacteraeota bacterium]